MNPVKPGYLTTEFWVTVATNVGAALVVFAPQLSERIGSQWVQPFAIAAAAVANVVYAHTRGKVKAAAASPLAAAPVPAGALPHANLNDEHPDVVKDWDAAKARAAEAHGTKPAARVRKR